MHNGIPIQTVQLSTGELYTPKKGERPEYPCRGCHKFDECLTNHSICDGYNDYEHMLAVWKRTVFD